MGSSTSIQSSNRSKIALPRLYPFVTLVLIGVNVAAFVLEESLGGSETQSVLIRMGAIYAPLMHDVGYIRLITAAFLHIGPAHLLANMYALFFIGRGLERVYGHDRFLLVYVLSGIVGNILSALTISPGVVAAGASGAILGCLVALIVLQMQYSHVLFGIGIGSAVLTLFYNLISGLAPGSGIDIAAHFGGALGGLASSILVRPPAAFLVGAKRQPAKPSEEARPDIISGDQGTATVPQQIVTVKKRTYSGARVVMALVVLLIVLLAVLAIPTYPRLQVEDVNLTSTTSFTPTFSGTARVQIAGQGTFYIVRVSVDLGYAPCVVKSTPSSVTLPQEFSIYIECLYFGSDTTTLAVTISGNWSPFGSVQIPVSLSSQIPIQQYR